MRILARFATFLIATVSTLGAQALPGHALVVTEGAGPVINLLNVDLDTGDISFFGSFASKFNKPLAVEIDPINQDIILAIRDDPALNGATFFAQWAILNGNELEMTNAVAIRIFASR